MLGAARDWLRQHGAAIIRGPVNPSTNYECGVLVDGFDSCPRIMMTYNYPYYGRLLEKAGLRKAKDLLSYDVLAAEARDGRVNALLERATQDGMRIRPLRLKEFEHEVELAWDLYNSAWARNWGFVPMTREEFMHHAHEMRPILVPELALFAEIGDQLAGFALAVPDINRSPETYRGATVPVRVAEASLVSEANPVHAGRAARSTAGIPRHPRRRGVVRFADPRGPEAELRAARSARGFWRTTF